ncbi:hypothetical protein IFM89_019818 [Coptis chinensis]|uniref:Uncharacterized protein n=1 Tax=Coptis chinensis TaxID=261450 RepID=A0A835I960_9MAGN|nr:hypothetical protein IFM89_019818 [Coptis chinensis]
MSIAFDNSAAIHGLTCMLFETQEKQGRNNNNNNNINNMAVIIDDEKNEELESCSSSSIGRNSDCESDDDGDGEVQSSYKGPLDSLDSLQEVLPIRRGISKFYSGKSKSFTCLADASSSSIKEIAKPENALTRKRKNNIAMSFLVDKNKNSPLKSYIGGSISKRLTNARRHTFNLTGTPTSSSESITSENSTPSSSPPRRLPPLHPQIKPPFNSAWTSQPNFSPRRAFSLIDLQIANENHNSSISNRDENKKHH